MLSRILSVLLFCAGLFCLAQAQVPMTGAGKGAPGAAVYSGPGNVVSGATAWWGLRAYTTAVRGTKAANVCNVSDVTCVDFLTDATTGALVVTTVGGSSCSVVVCTVKTLYDQSGSLSCSGAVACDLAQATIANRPQLIVSNGITGKAALLYNGTSQELVNNLPTGKNQPFSWSLVANTTNSASQQTAAGAKTDARIGYNNSGANTVFCFNGTVLTATASDGAWHGIQAAFNNAGSPQGDCNVDGVATTGNDGITQFGGSSYSLGSNTGVEFFKGSIAEGGFWGAVAFSAGNSSSMSVNQKSFWGYP